MTTTADAHRNANQSSSTAIKNDDIIHISLHGKSDLNDTDKSNGMVSSNNHLTQPQLNYHQSSDNISMTSRKSSLSLARPIEMPEDRRDIDRDSHNIDIMFIPSNGEQVASGDGEISENDIHLCHGNENDEHIKTVL